MAVTCNSFCRSVNHAGLALLVVAALSRCAWEESRELGAWASIIALHQAGQPTPIHTPIHDCDRESGCICRGATVVHPVDLAHLSDRSVEWLVGFAAVPVGRELTATGDGRPRLEEELELPPISGRQLRALYASLVI